MSSSARLFLVADSGAGGLGASALDHARWFAEHRWEVTIAAPGPLPGRDDMDSVDLPVPDSAFDLRAMLRAARLLRAEILARRPDIVHVHGARSLLLTLMSGHRPFVTIHGSGGRIPGQGYLGALARAASRSFAPLLARRAYSVAPARGRWETSPQASPRLRSLERTPLPANGEPSFLWLGRLDAPKRPEIFVRACAIASRVRPLRGVVVGSGPLLQNLRDLVREENVPVELVGDQDEIKPYLDQAWGLCLLSDFEGVPFAVQEAMWVGRAVVVSPLPSLAWFCGDAAGYAKNPDDVAAVLLRLSEKSYAADCGARAAERVRQMVATDAPYPRLLSDYERVLR